MKFNFVTGLACSVITGVLTLMPLAAKAESWNRIAQLPPVPERHLDQFHEDTHDELENILNSDQRRELRRAMEHGKSFPEAIADLDLSDHQRDELQTVFRQQARESRESRFYPRELPAPGFPR